MNSFWGRPGGGAPVMKDQSRKHTGNQYFEHRLINFEGHGRQFLSASPERTFKAIWLHCIYVRVTSTACNTIKVPISRLEI